jgi:hypothetical protein
LSLAAATHLEQDRSELDTLWQQRLERAEFETQRAGRHYHLVEPENRLVARQLAQEWETKLQEQQRLQEEYNRFRHQQPKSLSQQEQQMIRQLADNLPTLWHAPTTTPAQRKEIIRQVIDQIHVDVQGESEQVQVIIQWIGGDTTQAQIKRPVAKWTQLSNYPQLCQRLEQLSQTQLTTEEITACLNQEGFYPPKRRKTLNPEEIRTFIRRLGLGVRRLPQGQDLLGDQEWWLADLAHTLKMPAITLYNWVQRGWVNARQQADYPHHWIIWADDTEVKRLQTHRQRPQGEVLRQRWQGEVPPIAQCPPRD